MPYDFYTRFTVKIRWMAYLRRYAEPLTWFLVQVPLPEHRGRWPEASMTRGRRPLTALIEAEQIALRRGAVHMTPGARSNPFDLIIFEEHRNVFVRVKRSVSHFTDPVEVLYQYPA